MSLAQPIAWDSQNEPEPAPPDIESYGVIRLLARGGQGNLWLASRDADDQDCVIKTIFRFESGKAPTRERFLENCRLLASLDHPGLVGLIDYGVLPDSTLWQAMEYVAGRPLLDFIKAIDSKHTGNKARRSPTSAIARIVDLFIDVCDAVQAAHRVGIIHRDIKPSNILVDGAGRPRLLDFGIAKPISTEPGPAHTLTGHFVGSLAWSSPEQVECMPGNTDVRSDVYAIGVVMYQALTNAFPYDVTGPLSYVFNQILTTEPRHIREHLPSIDRDLDAIVTKALRKNPSDRYQTVADLHDDLKRWKHGGAVLARGDRLGYVLSKWMRRNRWTAAAVAAIVCLTVVYASTMTLMYRRATLSEHRAATAAEQAIRKSRLAQDSLNFFIGEVDGRLSRETGTLELRKSLLVKAYDKLAALHKERLDDPAMRADIAQAHYKMGDISEQLGHHDRAVEHLRAALVLREQLAIESPYDPAAQEALSIALVRVGDTSTDVHEKNTHYDRALQIDETLARRYPVTVRYHDNLGWSYERIGYQTMQRGNFAGAGKLLDKRLAIARRLVEAQPNNAVRIFGLHSAVGLMSQLCEKTGRTAEMVSWQRQAPALVHRMVELEPMNPEYRLLLGRAHMIEYEAARDAGDLTRACKLADQIVLDRQFMVAQDPGSVKYRQWLEEALALSSRAAKEAENSTMAKVPAGE